MASNHRDEPTRTHRDPEPAEPSGRRPPDPTPHHEPVPEHPVGDHAGHQVEPTGPVLAPPSPLKRTRISGTWVAVIVAAVILVFLLVFILQNLDTVTVSFLGFSGSLPLGVAMLFAAIAGAILIALVGTARILQLRRFTRRLTR